ncbi:MAG: hypothetical protein NTV84_03390 [Methanoregula sp.]|nr:hypothetical protein [Methanoregula sp.]
MGRGGNDLRQYGRRGSNDDRLDSMNPDNDAYDDIMDIYVDPSNPGNERYGWDEDDD